MNSSRLKIAISTALMASVIWMSAYALDTSVLIPSSSSPSASGTATINFDIDAAVTWPNNGRLVITFPTGAPTGAWDLTGIGVADASSPDGSVTGGFTVGVAGSVVTITRDATGGALITGTPYKMTLANVANPSETGTTGTFTIQLTNGVGTSLDVDTMDGVSISQPATLAGGSSSSGSSLCLVASQANFWMLSCAMLALITLPLLFKREALHKI